MTEISYGYGYCYGNGLAYDYNPRYNSENQKLLLNLGKCSLDIIMPFNDYLKLTTSPYSYEKKINMVDCSGCRMYLYNYNNLKIINNAIKNNTLKIRK